MSAPPDAANASASPTAASLPYDSEVLQLSYEAGSTASSASPASFTPAELAHYNSILSSQGPGSVRDFFLAKYESESVRNWDRMYRRHEDRAYKDRHYLTEEFRELGETMRADRAARGELPVAVPASQPEAEDDNDADAQPSAASSSSSAKSPPLRPIAEPTSVPSEKQRRLLEVGCGVGNALFPLLRLHPDLFCYGVDCSKNAIQVVQNHPDYDASGRAAAWVVDLVTEDLPLPIRSDHLDFATLIFVLSSIHPEKMHRGLRTIWRAMKKGEGVLFVRDYALYDMAQLRFAKTSKLGSNWYVRSDGTRSYFFTVDELCTLLRDAGFEILESTCVKKNVVNRKEKSEMSRRFVQVRARAVDRKVDIPQAEPVAIASSSDPAQAHTSDPQP